MTEQTNTAKNNMWMLGAGMLVVGLVAGFVIGWFWQKNGSQVLVAGDIQNSTSTVIVTTTSTVPALETTYQTIDVSATVSVDDQRAGSLVFIKRAEVSKPTWIAIREITNGSIGNILGAGMVTSDTDDVPVTLLRKTKPDGQYAVFLYQDNNDGWFDFKKDLLITQNSLPVAAMFTAQ